MTAPDFVEPDLVDTKDGRLIARHEPNLIATTHVATLPQFASAGVEALARWHGRRREFFLQLRVARCDTCATCWPAPR